MPLWYQKPSWAAVDRGVNFKLTSYPRRHGKDIEDLCMAARETFLRKGTYFYVFPTRKWAKRAVWDTMAEINGVSQPIIDHVFPPSLVRRKNETDLFLELINGSMFFMGGTDNLDFVGQGGQGYTMSEFSLHKEEVTSLLTPIIRQSQAYLHLNGTMRGKHNPLYRIYEQTKNDPKWFSTWLKPVDTKLYCWCGPEYNINPELLPLIGKVDPSTGELFANCQGVPYYNIQDDIDAGLISMTFARQEFLNEAVNAVENSYYGFELEILRNEGRYGSIDMTNDPVYTFWDLGTSDCTTIVFAQLIDDKFVVIDYHESSGKQIEFYAGILNSRGYQYAGHYAPHDVSKKMLFGDLVSAAMKVGINFRRVPKTSSVLEDIEVCRRGMKDLWVDERNEALFIHLESYHEGAGGKPCHNNTCKVCNGASHGADAVRTMFMAKHLGLIEHYLTGGKKITLPDTVSDKAEDYANIGWDAQPEGESVFWSGV
jgi:hypothetical protein